jgi:hypothetical protein
MEMEAGTGTAAGRDSVFVETTYEDRIDRLLRSEADPGGRLVQMGELAKEILAAGREEMEANNGLRRELERALPMGTLLSGQIVRTFVVGDVQDPELQAARILVELLEPLDEATRARLLSWTMARFGEVR